MLYIEGYRAPKISILSERKIVIDFLTYCDSTGDKIFNHLSSTYPDEFDTTCTTLNEYVAFGDPGNGYRTYRYSGNYGYLSTEIFRFKFTDKIPKKLEIDCYCHSVPASSNHVFSYLHCYYEGKFTGGAPVWAAIKDGGQSPNAGTYGFSKSNSDSSRTLLARFGNQQYYNFTVDINDCYAPGNDNYYPELYGNTPIYISATYADNTNLIYFKSITIHF